MGGGRVPDGIRPIAALEVERRIHFRWVSAPGRLDPGHAPEEQGAGGQVVRVIVGHLGLHMVVDTGTDRAEIFEQPDFEGRPGLQVTRRVGIRPRLPLRPRAPCQEDSPQQQAGAERGACEKLIHGTPFASEVLL